MYSVHRCLHNTFTLIKENLRVKFLNSQGLNILFRCNKVRPFHYFLDASPVDHLERLLHLLPHVPGISGLDHEDSAQVVFAAVSLLLPARKPEPLDHFVVGALVTGLVSSVTFTHTVLVPSDSIKNERKK